MAIERFAAAQNVELHRLEICEIRTVQNVVYVLLRNRLPNVHAHEDVAAANSLFGGGALGPHAGAGAAAAAARWVLPGVQRRSWLELEAQKLPRAIARFKQGFAWQRGKRQFFYDGLVVAL